MKTTKVTKDTLKIFRTRAEANAKRKSSAKKKRKTPNMSDTKKEVAATPVNEPKTPFDPLDDFMKKLSGVGIMTFGGPVFNETPSPKSDTERKLSIATRDLDYAKEKLKEQAAYLQKIADAGHILATVLEIRADATPPRMIISAGQILDVNLLEGAKVGDVVALNSESMQALHILPVAQSGQVAIVRAVLNGGKQIEIEEAGIGAGRVLRTAIPVVEGDRVVIDPSNSVVIQNLGKPKSQLAWGQSTNVTWDDVGGHDEAKKALKNAVETPALHPEVFARYGKKPCKGVLLYGPPGTGKTLLAKACATALARVHNQPDDVPAGFIYVKGPALLSKWVGESESSIRSIFNAAREHKKEHGFPAVVFIDEAEAILGCRGDGRGSVLTQTMVPQFLAEMDGLDDSGCMLLLATNRPGGLDPAVTREGRIDRKVRIGRPLLSDTIRIAQIHLKGRPVKDDVDLASILGNILHEDPMGLIVGPSTTTPLHLAFFSSGAMIAGIIEEAATSAMNRDLETGDCAGMTVEDLKTGVERIKEGLASLDHTDVLREIMAAHPELTSGMGPDAKPPVIDLGLPSGSGMSN